MRYFQSPMAVDTKSHENMYTCNTQPSHELSVNYANDELYPLRNLSLLSPACTACSFASDLALAERAQHESPASLCI